MINNKDFNMTFNLFGEHKTDEDWEVEEEWLEIQNNAEKSTKSRKSHPVIMEDELNKMDEKYTQINHLGSQYASKI